MTSRSVGATGAGVPIPSTTNRANACRRTPTELARITPPASRRGIQSALSTSHRVSSHGITPATTPGARRRKTTVPTAALPRLIRSDVGAGEPAASAGGDSRDVSVEHAAQSLADRSQQAEGDEDPRFGLGIAVPRDATGGLRALDHSDHELLNLAHVALEVLPDLGVVACFRQSLDPEDGD